MCAFMSLIDTACNAVDAVEEDRKEETETEVKYGKLITGLTIIVGIVGVVRAIDFVNKNCKLGCTDTADTEE